MSNASMPPKPCICRVASACCGCVGQPRVVDVRTFGWRARYSAMRLPVSVVLPAIRTASVLVPRSTSHESNGLRMAPAAFCTNSQPLDVVVAHRDDDAADAVAVAVQVLRRAVHDEVGAELDRPLQARARERVVDDQPDVVTRARASAAARRSVMRHHRVGRRLDEEQPRLRRDRPLDGVEVRGVHVAEGEPVAPQHLVEQPERAAVRVVGDDHVIAGS